jgi:serine/threonine-protein kinase RsbW
MPGMPRSGLLAFLRNPRSKKTITVPSETRYIRKVSEKILASLAGLGLDEGRAFDIRLCIEEAVRNAMVHGNHSDRRLAVRVTYRVEDGSLVIEVEDKGAGFDHRAVADPTLSPHIMKNSGRGVYLIRKLMDNVAYNDAGNSLTMTKNLK